jgi:threonyl-tRNA synthetase
MPLPTPPRLSCRLRGQLVPAARGGRGTTTDVARGGYRGGQTFWHSSAHVLGQALELEYGVDLTIGPAIDEGFYYDAFIGDVAMTAADHAFIQKRMEAVVKEKQEFQRVEVSRAEALDMFQENKFKVEIISNLAVDAVITLYRNGPMVDLCTGPHVPNTGYLKVAAVTQASRAYWRADAKKEQLQRVYGITFPDKKLMADYQHRMEEAKKRDHRTIGLSQELFFFNQVTPGSAFFLPNGTRIYNTLITYLREKYWEQEYDEVISPNIYNFDLWKVCVVPHHFPTVGTRGPRGLNFRKEDPASRPPGCRRKVLLVA